MEIERALLLSLPRHGESHYFSDRVVWLLSASPVRLWALLCLPLFQGISRVSGRATVGQ